MHTSDCREWLVIFYLKYVFYKVICAPPSISLVLHLTLQKCNVQGASSVTHVEYANVLPLEEDHLS